MEKKSSVLVLGCGADPTQRLNMDEKAGKTFEENFSRVITLDRDPSVKPTILANITASWWSEYILEKWGPLDEVHAYEVLQLLDYGPGREKAEGFFLFWQDAWDVLKPGGLFFAMTPWWQSKWVFQDPAATQVYTPEKLWYLDRTRSDRAMMTNYDHFWPEPYSFKAVHLSVRFPDPEKPDVTNAGFNFVLQKEVVFASKDEGGSDRGTGSQERGNPSEVLGGGSPRAS